MPAINLLPEELKPKTSVLQAAKTLTKVAKVVVVIFLLTALILSGVSLVLSNQIKQSQERQSDLRGQVKALEETEQRLFLLKDRLGKVKEIIGGNSAEEEVKILEDVVVLASSEVEVSQAKVDKDKANISVSTSNLTNLSKLLTDLVEVKNLNKIELSSFSFVPEKGYQVEFSFVR